MPNRFASACPPTDHPQENPPSAGFHPTDLSAADLPAAELPATGLSPAGRPRAGLSPADLAELGSARSTWPMDRQAAATFAAEAESVTRARQFVRITAAMWRLCPQTLADTELCI
ncbi:hypothetical protein, partial [Streptacidiphilus neutrinimicus]|uniref:hypothetical protein n=1 Tax=Streptacidiphilus neutrinimicus TaxID=105420 RepID=UPI003F71EE0C